MVRDLSAEQLVEALEDRLAIVDDVACYLTVPETEDPFGAGARLLEGGADWITFTSGSTVENFQARFNLAELVARFPQIQLASIGPTYCRMCGACGGVCDKGVPVPDVLRFLTYAEGYGQFALAREKFLELPAGVRDIRCGDCAKVWRALVQAYRRAAKKG